LVCNGEPHEKGSDVNTPDRSFSQNAENGGSNDATCDAAKNYSSRMKKSENKCFVN